MTDEVAVSSCLECGAPLHRTTHGLLTCDTDWCAGNLATRSRIPDSFDMRRAEQ